MYKKRVKLVKKEGASLLLQFSSPDFDEGDGINEFYNRLYNAALSALDSAAPTDGGLCTVRIDCELTEQGELLSVARKVRVSRGTKRLLTAEYNDLFDRAEHKLVLNKKYDKTKKNTVKERKKR